MCIWQNVLEYNVRDLKISCLWNWAAAFPLTPEELETIACAEHFNKRDRTCLISQNLTFVIRRCQQYQEYTLTKCELYEKTEVDWKLAEQPDLEYGDQWHEVQMGVRNLMCPINMSVNDLDNGADSTARELLMTQNWEWQFVHHRNCATIRRNLDRGEVG